MSGNKISCGDSCLNIETYASQDHVSGGKCLLVDTVINVPWKPIGILKKSQLGDKVQLGNRSQVSAMSDH